jgi:putative hemolysin
VDVQALFMAKNPAVASRLPGWVYSLIRAVAHEKDLNHILPQLEGLAGWQFAEAALGLLNIKVNIIGLDHLPLPAPGSAPPPVPLPTFCANHPLGGADGLAMMSLLGKTYGSFVHPSNDLLLSVPQLSDSIVPVNKHGTTTTIVQDIQAMYASDKPVLMFPAGRTARFRDHRLQDFPWAKSFIKKSREFRRPIVPVHISGRNSRLFYFIWRARTLLGIKPNLEMFMLVDELFKQRGTTLTLTIGKPIAPEVFHRGCGDADWAEALRLHVDALAADPDRPFDVEAQA